MMRSALQRRYVYLFIQDAYVIIGYICVSLLAIGNIVYFVSAYFAYSHFEVISMKKLGAKMIYHSINTWIQFHHSMVKSDLGLIIFIVLTVLLFDNDSVVLIVFDSLYFLLSVGIVLVFKQSVRVKLIYRLEKR